MVFNPNAAQTMLRQVVLLVCNLSKSASEALVDIASILESSGIVSPALVQQRREIVELDASNVTSLEREVWQMKAVLLMIRNSRAANTLEANAERRRLEEHVSRLQAQVDDIAREAFNTAEESPDMKKIKHLVWERAKHLNFTDGDEEPVTPPIRRIPFPDYTPCSSSPSAKTTHSATPSGSSPTSSTSSIVDFSVVAMEFN
jgi:hypothetical protein